MAETEKIKVEVEVAGAAVARPGDVVLIGFARPLTDQEIEWMKEDFRPITDLGVMIGFADSVNSMVVISGEDGPDAG